MLVATREVKLAGVTLRPALTHVKAMTAFPSCLSHLFAFNISPFALESRSDANPIGMVINLPTLRATQALDPVTSVNRALRSLFDFALLVCLCACWLQAQDYPKAEISNGLIHAEIMLPDSQNGSYRGTRFDWSGVISSLTFDGHEYFGRWYEHHDPKIHDAITGPVEEFRTNDKGLGYDEAKPGDTFVRIGVGTVRKPDEPAYRAYDTYDIVDPGKWTIRKHKDRIEFTHRLKSEQGYAYIYRKTLRLVKGKPELLIEHSLKNTGQKTIDTTQYNHNFFVIDHEVVGPDVVAKFVFTPVATRGFKDRAEIHEHEIVFPQELQGKNGVFSELTGSSPDVQDYDFRVENRNSGAGVHITSDQPLDKVNFWAIRTVAAVEPYIHLTIDPGQEARWTIRYDFYTLPPASQK